MGTRGDRQEQAALACRVLGTVLVALGLTLGYTTRAVFNPDAFAARAAGSLGDPRVSGWLSEQIADGVIAQKRDLTAFRPLIVGAARTTVASEGFRTVFRRSAAAAHTAAFSKGAQIVYLSLPDVGILLKSALSTLDPALVARVPDDLSAQAEALAQSRAGAVVMRLLEAGQRMRRLALAAIALGAILLVAGVAVARDRRRGLLRAGLALALGAFCVFLLAALGGRALAWTVEPEVRPLVRGLWDAFFGSLQRWALVLGGVGLVSAAAASSLASRGEVERALTMAWDALQRPAATWRAELLRAGTLLGCGLLFALAPEAGLRLLTVLIGALLAFEGLRHAFSLLGPLQAEETAPAGVRADGNASPRAPAWRFVVLGAVILATAVGAAAFLGRRNALPLPSEVLACNGDVRLCDRPLDQVVLPGAHNAMSSADAPGWLFPNQERGIPAQLQRGIRALLFDVHYGTPVAGAVRTEFQDEAERGKFEKALGKEGLDAAMRIRDRLVGEPDGPRALYLCHGFCELGAKPLVPVLTDVRSFLVAHPFEVVVLVVEDYVAAADMARAFADAGLDRTVYRGPVGPPWPTLRQMIVSGERVLVLAEHQAAGVPWYHLGYDLMQETPYTFHTKEELSCRANRGGDGKAFFLMNHWIETTPTPRPMNAEVVNQRAFLVARARQCEQERGRRPTILAVDFAMTGDVVGAAAELNGLTASP